MRTVVVYESSFGNTRQLAEAMATELRKYGEVEVQSVATPLATPRPDLLVVGAPTHAHGMSWPRTRGDALKQQHVETESNAGGVREWIDELLPAHGYRAAAFDTRFEKPLFLTGSAAHAIARRLRRRGYTLAAGPASFFVTGTSGPLKDGELERAAAWANELALGGGMKAAA